MKLETESRMGNGNLIMRYLSFSFLAMLLTGYL